MDNYTRIGFFPFRKLLDQDAPCAVCEPVGRVNLMVPGTYNCPQGWTQEYKGYLMSSHYTHARSSEYICVDEAPEGVNGGTVSVNGALLYFVTTIHVGRFLVVHMFKAEKPLASFAPNEYL